MSKEQRYTYYIDEFDEFDWAITDNTTDESYEYLEDITKVLNEQDQKIKELEHRLSNCIEPKFKQGDYLYSAEKSGSQILLAEGYVTTITQLDDGSIWYHLSAKPHEFGVRETTCYKTMDEVHEVCQKLLKEIDDEKNNRKS